MKDPLVAILQGGVQRPGSTAAEVAGMVAGDSAAIERLVGLLDNADPRVRGGAADGLAELAEREPGELVPHVTRLVAALAKDEACATCASAVNNSVVRCRSSHCAHRKRAPRCA